MGPEIVNHNPKPGIEDRNLGLGTRNFELLAPPGGAQLSIIVMSGSKFTARR